MVRSNEESTVKQFKTLSLNLLIIVSDFSYHIDFSVKAFHLLTQQAFQLSNSLFEGTVYLLMPITPQATRAPAFPVFRLSSSPPFPKSSFLA